MRMMSSAILIISIIVAVVCYIVIFSSFEQIWTFNAVFFLCLVTFLFGAGVFLSAFLRERILRRADLARQEQQ